MLNTFNLVFIYIVRTGEDIPGIGSEELEAVVRSWKMKRLIVMAAPESALGLFHPTGDGVAVVASDAPFNRRPLAHELTHYLQRQAGQDPTGWKQERQAQWVERHFDAWCRHDIGDDTRLRVRAVEQ